MLISEVHELFCSLSRNEKRLLKSRFEVVSAHKAMMLFEYLSKGRIKDLSDKYVCYSIYGKEGGSDFSHLKDYFFRSVMSVCISTKIVSESHSNSPDYLASIQHMFGKELVARGFFHWSFLSMVKVLTPEALYQLSEEMKILFLTRVIRSFGNQFLDSEQLANYSLLLDEAVVDMALIAKYSSLYKLIVNDESNGVAQTYGIMMQVNKVALNNVKEDDIALEAIQLQSNRRLKSILCRIAILWYKSNCDYSQVKMIMEYYESIQKDQKGNENEMGGLKFAMGLNYMMMYSFNRAIDSFDKAIYLFSQSNEKSFHAMYFKFVCGLINDSRDVINRSYKKLEEWKIDQSGSKMKYYLEWKKLTSAIRLYYEKKYRLAYNELQELTELYRDRFGWRMTIKYLEILCLLRLGDYDRYTYKHDSFRKYYYLVKSMGDQIDIRRIEEFYRLLSFVHFENGHFFVSNRYTYMSNRANWNPIGWEVFDLSMQWNFLKQKQKL